MNKLDMNKLVFYFVGILLIIACDKEEIANYPKSIFGTWNKSKVTRLDESGNVIDLGYSTSGAEIDKLSISDSIMQYLYVDTLYQTYVLRYCTYNYVNGILKKFPDKLIDSEMQTHYWNPIDSLFGNHPTKSYPFESIIEKPDNDQFLEIRKFEDGTSLKILYEKINSDFIDFKDEFEYYINEFNNTKNNKEVNQENINLVKMTKMPMYNK